MLNRVRQRWGAFVARDAQRRQDSAPNAAGGLGNLLYSLRPYVLVVAIVAVPALVLFSLLR
jgi:hypothetical protein